MFQSLLKWILSVVAVAVIVLALLVGVARLLLPQVPEYREEIRDWVMTATGFDLDFDGIGASWPLSGPELHLYDVRLTREDLPEFVVLADEISVGVSILRFVQEGRLIVGRFGLTGTNLTVERGLDRSWKVQGIDLASMMSGDQPAELPDLNVRLDDIALRFSDPRSESLTEVFMVEEARVDLDGSRIRLDSELSLESADESRFEVSVDWSTSTELPATRKVYVATRDFEFARWQALAPNLVMPISTVQGDATIWADLSSGGPQSFTTEFAFDPFVVSLPERQPQLYDRIAGRIEWSRSGRGWLLDASGIEFTRGESVWPESAFRVTSTVDQRGGEQLEFSLDFLRLDDLLPLIYAVSTPEMRDGQLPRSISGDVSAVSGSVARTTAGVQAFDVDGRFEGLGLAAPEMGIAFSNVSGAVSAGEQGGRLRIDSVDSTLVLSGLFRSPLAMERLDGNVVWRKTANGLTFLSDRIEVDTGSLRATATLEVEYPDGTDPVMLDLTASGSLTDARLATRYLPTEKMPPKVVAWLDQAFIGGSVPNWNGTFRGALREFPFDHGEGEFRIESTLVNGRLSFAPDWPPLEDIDAVSVFDGVSLYSTENSSRFLGARFTNSEVRIGDLRKGDLVVSSAGPITVAQLLPILRDTPIADALGKTVNSLVGNGTMDTKLRLDLPIKRIRDWSMNGAADLRGTDIGLSGFPHNLTDLRGAVAIDRRGLSGTGIQGEFLGEPVVIDITNDTGDPQIGHVAISEGSTSAESIAAAFNLPMADYYDGPITWQARAALPLQSAPGEQPGPPLTIGVAASLEALESRLPVPLTKARGDTESLSLGLVFPEGGVVDLEGAIDSGIEFVFRFDGLDHDDDWSIERGAVTLGGVPAVMPDEDGIAISGETEFLRLGDWLALVDGQDREARWSELYRDVAVHVDRLAAFGYVLPDTDVLAARQGENWRVEVESDRATGQVTLPISADRDVPIVVDMARLHFTEPDDEDTSRSGTPGQLPAIRVSVEDFRLSDMTLGALELDANAVPGGLLIDRIDVGGDSFSIAGTGRWLEDVESGEQSSSLELSFDSASFAKALSDLGYSPMIESKAATGKLDITWPGGPGSTFLSEATGVLGVDIGAGQIVDIEPGAGRMFGLMSVSALPRRLALDFRDVFDKGLAFDRLAGEFNLDGGNAYTCNLGLVGSVANVGLVGRTGIASKDYEQIAVVQPHVSNALPITGVLVGGPGAGAALWLISRIFRKPLSSIGESYYVVNGPWDDPVIDQVQRTELDMTAFQDCEAYLARVLPAREPPAAAEARPTESGP